MRMYSKMVLISVLFVTVTLLQSSELKEGESQQRCTGIVAPKGLPTIYDVNSIRFTKAVLSMPVEVASIADEPYRDDGKDNQEKHLFAVERTRCFFKYFIGKGIIEECQLAIPNVELVFRVKENILNLTKDQLIFVRCKYSKSGCRPYYYDQFYSDRWLEDNEAMIGLKDKSVFDAVFRLGSVYKPSGLISLYLFDGDVSRRNIMGAHIKFLLDSQSVDLDTADTGEDVSKHTTTTLSALGTEIRILGEHLKLLTLRE